MLPRERRNQMFPTFYTHYHAEVCLLAVFRQSFSPLGFEGISYNSAGSEEMLTHYAFLHNLEDEGRVSVNLAGTCYILT